MKIFKMLRIGLLLGPILALALLTMSSTAYSQDVNTYIPKNAVKYIPGLMEEKNRIFPDIPLPHYLAGLVEQESCISLKSKNCWSPTVELKTSREYGAGFFQTTKAYTSTGALRFDTLGDLRRKYPEELKDLGWDNIKDRPDLQLRAGILLVRDNYNALKMIPNPYDRLAMADSAYNGGMGNLQKSRKVCGLAKDCDPNLWYGNVENYLVQSRAALYGKRSANDINKEHVEMTTKIRLWKYREYLY